MSPPDPSPAPVVEAPKSIEGSLPVSNSYEVVLFFEATTPEVSELSLEPPNQPMLCLHADLKNTHGRFKAEHLIRSKSRNLETILIFLLRADKPENLFMM